MTQPPYTSPNPPQMEPPPTTFPTNLTEPYPPKMSRKAIIFTALGIVAVLAVGAALVVGVTKAKSPKTFEMTGNIEITGTLATSSALGFTCEGGGGYRDISAGRDILVYDQDDNLIGKGSFTGSSKYGKTCSMDFTVPDVPRGVRFYQLSIGNRNKMTYTEAEAEEGVALTLGS